MKKITFPPGEKVAPAALDVPEWSPDGTDLQWVYVVGQKGHMLIAWCQHCKAWVVADFGQYGHPPGSRALDVEGICDPWTYDAGGRAWTAALDKPPKPRVTGLLASQLCWNAKLGLWQTAREFHANRLNRPV